MKTLYTCGELRKMNGVRVRIEWEHLRESSDIVLCVDGDFVEGDDDGIVVARCEKDDTYPTEITSIQVIEETPLRVGYSNSNYTTKPEEETPTGDWREELSKMAEKYRDASEEDIQKMVYYFIQQQINKAEEREYNRGLLEGQEKMKEKIIWMAEVTPDGQVVVPIDKIYSISNIPTNE